MNAYVRYYSIYIVVLLDEYSYIFHVFNVHTDNHCPVSQHDIDVSASVLSWPVNTEKFCSMYSTVDTNLKQKKTATVQRTANVVILGGSMTFMNGDKNCKKDVTLKGECSHPVSEQGLAHGCGSLMWPNFLTPSTQTSTFLSTISQSLGIVLVLWQMMCLCSLIVLTELSMI